MAPERVTCPACGAGRDPEDTFCGNCGAALDGSSSQGNDTSAPSIEDLHAALLHGLDSRRSDIAFGVLFGLLMFSFIGFVAWVFYFMATNGG